MKDNDELTGATSEASIETNAQEAPETEQANDDEFKLTIRKLEMPVRPRGVLAD